MIISNRVAARDGSHLGLRARKILRTGAILAGGILLASSAQAAFVTVDLTSYYTGNWSGESFSSVPTGNVTLGGTDFYIGEVGGIAGRYAAGEVGGPNPIVLNVPVSVFGVTNAYSLINTFWGQTGLTSIAVTFNATGGLTQTFNLTGNVDVRDYFQNIFTNSINGTTTQQVYIDGSRRLDRQAYSLLPGFATETLTSVVFTDTGANGVQRLALTALTLETAEAAVPEPASWLMMIAGFGMLGGALRRRERVARLALA